MGRINDIKMKFCDSLKRLSSNKKKPANKKGSKSRLLLAMLLIILSLFAASAAASAFWTDGIATGSIVSSLKLKIDYGEDGVVIEEADQILPGDMKKLRFTVKNTGDISADVRPVISISSDKMMCIGASEYLLCDELGEPIEGYEPKYFLGKEEVEARKGNTYDRVEYTKTVGNTLCGGIHKDAEQDLDMESKSLISEKTYELMLKLSENSGNDLMGALASINVDTIAVQHRFSDGLINEALDELRKETASPSDMKEFQMENG